MTKNYQETSKSLKSSFLTNIWSRFVASQKCNLPRLGRRFEGFCCWFFIFQWTSFIQAGGGRTTHFCHEKRPSWSIWNHEIRSLECFFDLGKQQHPPKCKRNTQKNTHFHDAQHLHIYNYLGCHVHPYHIRYLFSWKSWRSLPNPSRRTCWSMTLLLAPGFPVREVGRSVHGLRLRSRLLSTGSMSCYKKTTVFFGGLVAIYVKHSVSGKYMANFYLVSRMLFTFHNPQMWKIRTQKENKALKLKVLIFPLNHGAVQDSKRPSIRVTKSDVSMFLLWTVFFFRE